MEKLRRSIGFRQVLSHRSAMIEHVFDTYLQQVSGLADDRGVDDVLRLLKGDDIVNLSEELLAMHTLDEPPAAAGEWRPSMADTVLVMRAQARLVAHHRARMLEAIACLLSDYEELADGDVEAAIHGAVAEIRCALSLTRRAAEVEVDLAWRLRDRLPAVGRALFAGDLDVERARVIVYGTDRIDVEVARRIVDEVLDAASSMTTGQLRALVRRLCVEADPEDAAKRYEEAVDGRKVTAELTVDGTGAITASDLPADRVAAAMDRIDRIARQLNWRGESRTIDQLRADVFLDLLTGGDSNIRANIDMTVDVETLAQLADRSAEQGGMGPIIADMARGMANTYGSKWRYAVTDPAGGVLVAGTTRRRPTTAIRRAVELRDRTCTFPGCRRPAQESDLDHMTPWSQGGNTDVHSTAACCRHDHVVRHRFDWSYSRNADGSYAWTAPSGCTYTRPPPL